MKHMYSLFTLLSLSQVIFASSMHVLLDGVWYSRQNDRMIEVLSSNQGVKIYGLFAQPGWTYFEYEGKDRYEDRRKNRIVVKSRNTLVYYDRRSRVKLTFRLIKSKFKNTDHDHYSYHNNISRPISPGPSTYPDREQGDYTLYEKNSNNKITKSPEGIWAVEGVNKTVVIIDTRDGIKAKFSDDSVWFIYKLSKDDRSIFLSEQGQSYHYIDNDRMVWTDKNLTKKFYLYRKTDKWE